MPGSSRGSVVARGPSPRDPLLRADQLGLGIVHDLERDRGDALGLRLVDLGTEILAEHVLRDPVMRPLRLPIVDIVIEWVALQRPASGRVEA